MKSKFYISMVILSISLSTTPVLATDSTTCIQNNSNSMIFYDEYTSLYSTDKIEYKYRYNSEGVLQYRRWNATKNCWVDSSWIDLN